MSPFSLSRRLSKKWMVMMIVLGLSISTGIAYMGYQAVYPLNHVSNMFYDVFQQQVASGQAASHTVIIDIDDVSLNAVGQWPWPRYRVATLVKAIADMKPAAIGLDIIFSEEDRTALMNIRKAFKSDFNLDINFTGIPPNLTDNDGYLGSVLSGTGTVGAEYLYFDHQSKVDTPHRSSFAFTGRTDLLDLHDASGILDNTYKISSQLKYAGFINIQPDDDGMLRRLPLLIRHQGKIYPHLVLATFMRSHGLHTASVEETEYGPVIQAGEHRIPITENGFALLQFNGSPHLYRSVSARDVLNGHVDEQRIRDKIVFIGSSSAGLNDLHSTLFDAQFPGVKTLAAMVENFTDGNAVIEPVWADIAIFSVSLLTGCIVSLLFAFVSNALLVLVGSLAWGTALLAGSFSAYTSAGLFLNPAPALVITLLLLTLFSATRFVLEKKSSSLFFRQLTEARAVVHETLDETLIARKLVMAACDLLECTSGTVGLYKHGKMVFSEYVEGDAIKAIDFKCLPGQGVAGLVLQNKKSYLSNHAMEDPHVMPEFRSELAFNRLINVPISDGDGELLGCLEVHDRLDGRAFAHQDVEVLESLSDIVASALMNAHLLANIRNNEKEIAAAAERLNRILDADFDAVIAHQHSKVIYANKAARDLFGYPTLEQTLGKNPMDYISETYRDRAMQAVRKAVQSGKSHGPIEMEALHPESREAFPIELASTPIVWEGKPALVSIVRDISERKQREEGMRLLESAVASISESIIITDTQGVIVYANPAFTKNTGYTDQEVIGSTPSNLHNKQPGYDFYNRLWDTVRSGQLWRGRILNCKKDGTVYPAQISAAPIFNAEGVISHFVAVYEDLSENEELQKKMMQAQKMEAVGTMVGGLAHDFNNMLASLVGNLYLMSFDHEDDEEMMERISSMEGSVHHAANMIKQMLTFARKDRPSKQPMDMLVFVKEAYKLSHATLSEDINFLLNYPGNKHICVNGDATQLQQVLLNLVTNARHAVEHVDDAEITLELDESEPSAELLNQNLEAHSEIGWCHIRCSDNGCGMSPGTLEHVFEPFFTTKQAGVGTGLGLAMVYGAIQNHQGIIDVESVQGQGTTVSIWLPLQQEEAVQVYDEDRLSVDGSGKTVLLVDDEKELLSVVAEVLSRSNFSVLQASDGIQAVDLFRSHSASVDLVLMDVVMPHKGGVIAAKEIRELDAEVPIIFQTGYGERAQLEAAASISNSDSLQKPVLVPELLKKIMELIG
ncbi:hypothetical protein MMIC_P1922 [Mariprofundus micogutta]|uniref:histidine kinase n=1 Tax=Mariprofundus micogutta TaxID=1921010 RepID=A0A1L8CPY2_9PROT|nr:CHASE2 domain-containing protein [Mariprofundus micogutta]GAV20944.1 hypothetical protein MMIC_P1922 [Mariprofundus micogutta]